jgi:hypothetical protein
MQPSADGHADGSSSRHCRSDRDASGIPSTIVPEAQRNR